MAVYKYQTKNGRKFFYTVSVRLDNSNTKRFKRSGFISIKEALTEEYKFKRKLITSS